MKSGARLFIWIVVVPLLLGGQSCSRYYSVKKNAYTLYPLAADLPKDSSIIQFYAPFKAAIDSQMQAVIGMAAFDIKRKRPEGILNNLYADAMGLAAKQQGIQFDFVHNNFYSLRQALKMGPIKTYQVYELMPFENFLVTVSFTGAQLQELFNYMASQGGDPIAGASFRIRKGMAETILINGKPLDLLADYTVLTSDYLANGGDGAEIYSKATNRKEYQIKVRDALLLYITKHTQAGKPLAPELEGRVIADREYKDE